MEYTFISICDLYSYDEIFKDINLPQSLKKETLINCIMRKCGVYEPIYVDMPLLNQMIKNFFNVNYKNFEKICYLYDLKYKEDYNPIFNKDGTIIENESYTKNSQFNNNKNSSENNENISQVSAYDSSSFQNDSKNNENMNTNSNEKGVNDENFTHNFERVEKGNIGVTTTSQMIKEEYNIQSTTFNKYEFITTIFYDEFFIHY